MKKHIFKKAIALSLALALALPQTVGNVFAEELGNETVVEQTADTLNEDTGENLETEIEVVDLTDDEDSDTEEAGDEDIVAPTADEDIASVEDDAEEEESEDADSDEEEVSTSEDENSDLIPMDYEEETEAEATEASSEEQTSEETLAAEEEEAVETEASDEESLEEDAQTEGVSAEAEEAVTPEAEEAIEESTEETEEATEEATEETVSQIDTLDATVRVTGIRLNATSLTIAKGNTHRILATVQPSNATNKGITWTSSNTGVIAVDGGGLIKGMFPGTATITATTKDGGKRASCVVKCFVPVTGIKLNSSAITLKKGNTHTIKATVLPGNATNKSVTWSSNNTGIASVNSSGAVKGVSPGVCYIYAKTVQGGKVARCRVTVTRPVTGVKLNRSSFVIHRGRSYTLSATVYPSDATNKAVVWSAGNTRVASVNSHGTVKANNAGTTYIIVKTKDGGKIARCKVTVTIPVSGIRLNSSKFTLKKGYYSVLRPTISPSNATNKGVTWSSSNTGVASVDAHGKVVGRGHGSCTITARTKDGGKVARCTVNVYVPVTKLTISKTYMALNKGSSSKLSCSVSPSNATYRGLVWSSGNTHIATVDRYGNVRGVGRGVTMINVRSAEPGNKLLVRCKVDVQVPVTKITITSGFDIYSGKSYTIRPTIYPSDASDKTVYWSSSNTSVATVSSSGTVYAKSVGVCYITAKTKSGGHYARCRVNVKSSTVHVTGVTLNRTGLNIKKGASASLVATVSPSNATNKSVTWITSDSSIASVDSSGVVTGNKVGECKISVKTNDGNKKATCTVRVKKKKE